MDKNTGEIVLYQPDHSLQLEVRLENETVWLTQSQMSELFLTTRNNVTMHISNIFKEGELEKDVVCKDFLLTTQHGAIEGKWQTKSAKLYSLDVIISVGYRIKSQRGTQFRIWAREIIKDYMLRGYAINQRFERIENRLADHAKKIDFFVKTALPPVEGIFYDGQTFDAYNFVADLIKSATKSIVLIDNYIDDSILMLLSKRGDNISATVYTSQIRPEFQIDLERYNTQYQPITIKLFTKSHDRFLIIDDAVYHIGASLKDAGKKWFAFSKMQIKANDLLEKMVL